MKKMSDSYPSNTNNSVMREHLISFVPLNRGRVLECISKCLLLLYRAMQFEKFLKLSS